MKPEVKIIIAVIVFLVVVFIFLLVVVLSGSKDTTSPTTSTDLPVDKPAPATEPPVVFTPVQDSPVPHDTTINTPNITPEPIVQRPGVWLRNPGGGYVSGLTPAQSVDYCAGKGARISTADDLRILNDGVFRYCSSGWYLNTDGSYANAWFEDGSDPKSCGPKGMNSLTNDYVAELGNKLGTYCTGIIPTSPEVGASKLF